MSFISQVCSPRNSLFHSFRISKSRFAYFFFYLLIFFAIFSPPHFKGDSFFFSFCLIRFCLIILYFSASLSKKKTFHEGPESEMHILFTRLCVFFLTISSRRKNILCVWFFKTPFFSGVCFLSFDYFLYENCVSRFVGGKIQWVCIV